MQEEVQYRLLRLVDALPGCSQREMARQLGMSVGRVNHCLKTLLAEGLLVNRAEEGRRVCYRLSSAGREAGARLRLRVLQHKLDEFEHLRRDIEVLWEEMAAPVAPAPTGLDPEWGGGDGTSSPGPAASVDKHH